jgi:hypothetical protein
MGNTLSGLTPSQTFQGLIKVGNNTNVDGTAKVLSDGAGTDLPMEVSTAGVNLTGSPTVNSVAIANTNEVATKQDTLISGTNIKTINGTTVLGSGDIVTPTTPPSGVSGAIQFTDGSAFASDAANLFYDDTNNNLGVGTDAPTATTHIKGSGTTSATTSLLVQNSAGTNLLIVRDNATINTGTINATAVVSALMVLGNGFPRLYYSNAANANLSLNAKNITVSTSAYNAGSSDSAVLEVNSTTQGFLPPRMTTTQKNAIATPAAGLQVYDTTLNQMSYYNGSSWVNF